MAQIRIGESRYIQGRDTGARPAFRVGESNWELTTDTAKTNGSPMLRLNGGGANYYIREKFGGNISLSINMYAKASGHGGGDDGEGTTVTQECKMYIADIKTYDQNGSLISSSITSNFRNNGSNGSGGVTVTPYNTISNVTDGNLATFIGVTGRAVSSWGGSSTVNLLGDVSISNTSGIATKVEIYYGYNGDGRCCWSKSHAFETNSTIVEGYVKTNLSGVLVSHKAYSDNDKGGDNEGIARFKLTFLWDGSSWTYSESAW